MTTKAASETDKSMLQVEPHRAVVLFLFPGVWKKNKVISEYSHLIRKLLEYTMRLPGKSSTLYTSQLNCFKLFIYVSIIIFFSWCWELNPEPCTFQESILPWNHIPSPHYYKGGILWIKIIAKIFYGGKISPQVLTVLINSWTQLTEFPIEILLSPKCCETK